MVYQELQNYLRQEKQKIVIIAENDGKLYLEKKLGKQRITIEADNGDSSSYLIPKGKHINFNQGEKIKKVSIY